MTEVQVRQAPAENANQMETWKNVSKGKCIVKRIGEFGKKHSEVIPGGKTFMLLPAERRLNQNICSDPKLDIFKNGRLSPVELIDGEQDNEELLRNPNLLPKEDELAIFKLSTKRFAERLEEIDSISTLQRLLELSEQESTKATVMQHRAITDRLEAIDTVPLHIKPSVQQAILDGKPGPQGEVSEFKPIRLGR